MARSDSWPRKARTRGSNANPNPAPSSATARPSSSSIAASPRTSASITSFVSHATSTGAAPVATSTSASTVSVPGAARHANRAAASADGHGGTAGGGSCVPPGTGQTATTDGATIANEPAARTTRSRPMSA